MIVKIIYFDEGSATDLIYITDGGVVESHTQNIVKTSNRLMASVAASIKAKLSFFSFFKTSAAAKVDGGASRERNVIIQKAISNTILTDYLKLVNTEKVTKNIVAFSDCLLFPYPDSFTYYKMLTPLLTMTEGGFAVDKGLRVNVALMDKALESSRGYYELILEQNSIKSVLRFNIQAFRNNYSISDLTKMNLYYHAVEVGAVQESSLSMKNEFEQNAERLSAADIAYGQATDKDYLKVYDVIFAGVKK